jgi:uncharacterized membrane protein
MNYQMNYRIVTALLSLLGIADAGYLLYTRLAGVSINCGPVFHGCDTVAASSYSTMFGMPLSLYGLLFYAAILACVVAMHTRLLTFLRMEALRAYVPTLLLTASTLGVVSSAYFTYLQAFVINAWCTYCIISACISVCIFVLVLLVQKETRTL